MILVVFRTRVRPENEGRYYALVDEMDRLVQAMPGFISEKTFRHDDGERVSIQEWETAAHVKAWREHPQHKAAQEAGRTTFYEEYALFVAEDPRASRFKR